MAKAMNRMFVQTFASGSSGNATFVRMGDTRLLLDAGISRKRIVTSLAAIGESLDTLDAILLTHIHADHVSGVEAIREHDPEVVIAASRGTRTLLKRRIPGRIRCFDRNVPTTIGEVSVTAFPVPHDSADPVGYRLEAEHSALALATDLGSFDHHVVHAIQDVQCLILEANHCRQMLAEGPYPARLKRRVGGRRGHLSNDQARQLLRQVAGPRLEHVILCHLSEENNAPLTALACVSPAVDLDRVRVTAAPRQEAGPPLAFDVSVAHGRGAAPPSPGRQIPLPFAAAASAA